MLQSKKHWNSLKMIQKFSLWFNVNDVGVSKVILYSWRIRNVNALKIDFRRSSLNFEVKNKRIQILT